jgi:hypothetical protein
MFKKFLFSNGRNMPEFSITIAFFIASTTSDVSKYAHSMQCEKPHLR